MDTNEVIKTLLRVGLILITATSAFFSRLIFKTLDNERVSYLAKKAFLGFLFFTIARLISAIIDARLPFEIGWSSSAVTYAFNFWVLWAIVKIYLKFREEEYEIHKTGEAPMRNPYWVDKRKVSALASEMLDELKVQMRRTDRLADNIGS